MKYSELKAEDVRKLAKNPHYRQGLEAIIVQMLEQPHPLIDRILEGTIPQHAELQGLVRDAVRQVLSKADDRMADAHRSLFRGVHTADTTVPDTLEDAPELEGLGLTPATQDYLMARGIRRMSQLRAHLEAAWQATGPYDVHDLEIRHALRVHGQPMELPLDPARLSNMHVSALFPAGPAGQQLRKSGRGRTLRELDADMARFAEDPRRFPRHIGEARLTSLLERLAWIDREWVDPRMTSAPAESDLAQLEVSDGALRYALERRLLSTEQIRHFLQHDYWDDEDLPLRLELRAALGALGIDVPIPLNHTRMLDISVSQDFSTPVTTQLQIEPIATLGELLERLRSSPKIPGIAAGGMQEIRAMLSALELQE